MKIGDKIRKARKSKNYVLKDVSKLTNISVSYLSDIENDRSNPPLDTLEILCKVLDIPLYDFFPTDHAMLVKEDDPDTLELHSLLQDFRNWDRRDKDELISYLKAKRLTREEK